MIPKRRNKVKTLIVEIRAGEGGEDARLLVEEQYKIYRKYAERRKL